MVIQNILNKARNIQKSAIEGMYEDLCTIYVKSLVKDPDTGISEHKDVVIVENEPCRLSYRTMPSTSDAMKNSEYADTVNQVISLFIRPDLKIPSGSKTVITKFGNTDHDDIKVEVTYSNSAKQKIHGSHQEIILMMADKYGE